jgi:hypothetical protein
LNSSGANGRQAADYAELYGLHVLPVRVRRDRKEPLTRLAPKGWHNATTDLDVITGWWAEEPDANIGIACRPSGLLVIEVDHDERYQGLDELHELEREHGSLPNDAWRSLTGGGGLHVFVRNPERRTASSIAPGVQLRDRAYVVAPRSLHKSGRRYEWEIGPDETAIAELPETWLPLILRRRGDRTQLDGPIPEGRRNNTLVRIAGAMRRAGLGEQEIAAALTITNATRCQPPLDDRSLNKIVRWIAKQNTAPKWALDAAGYVADLAAGGLPLTAVQRHVLITLCHRANEGGHVIGGNWIQRETGYGSNNTTHRALKALAGHGLIEISRQHRRTNQITLRLPELE